MFISDAVEVAVVDYYVYYFIIGYTFSELSIGDLGSSFIGLGF